jgi:hypothetical protein
MLPLFCGVAFVPALCGSHWWETDATLAFAFSQWRSTPRMGIEDAYKWLFHATLGGEHAVTDDDGPRQWLEREWKTLGPPMPGEKEVTPLTPDGRLIRVNLRPYRAGGGDEEMLLAVFVASARGFHADRRVFVDVWEGLGRRLKGGPFQRLRYPEWVRLDRETATVGYPAIDHSSDYERTYHPAYRVVLGSMWPVKWR